MHLATGCGIAPPDFSSDSDDRNDALTHSPVCAEPAGLQRRQRLPLSKRYRPAQGQILLELLGELQTRLVDIAEGGILQLNFTSKVFTDGKILFVITSHW
ncbi:hypothetical protein JQ609_19530 [Bradyrhizobium sp. AUGA SZCCT0169]|uniref:hypothetical protein n=1 Tax=Bradyrhizobium sp. AUGA SZCCT0169 TaxID=2807663 RepID=UPI001BA520C7|nr:hypothetical protein [Bradyrhizobium sp. AUGA SZCCT0169]MBR1249113.1 hypothetical protein [Bradyrhizobium sp. AUGA SZCCT0169]